MSKNQICDLAALHRAVRYLSEDPIGNRGHDIPAKNTSNLLHYIDKEVMLLLEEYGEREADPLFRESSDVRLAQASGLGLAMENENSFLTLSKACSYIINNFSERIKDEISGYCTSGDDSGRFFGNSFLFRISFLSFCNYHSSFAPMETEQKNKEAMDRLRKEGYIIEEFPEDHFSRRLVDCDTNRQKLIEYLVSCGCKKTSIRFKSNNNAIIDISCNLQYDKFLPYTVREMKYPDIFHMKDVTGLTEDQHRKLTETIKDLSFAILSFEQMEDKKMMVSLFASYLYMIESLLCEHLSVWERMEAKCAPEREKNGKIYQLHEDASLKAFQIMKDPSCVFRRVSTNLERLANEHGLTISIHSISEHDHLFFSVGPDQFTNKSFSVLDGVDDNGYPCIIFSNDKLNQIHDIFSEIFDDVQVLQNIEAAFINGETYLRKVFLSAQIKKDLFAQQ